MACEQGRREKWDCLLEGKYLEMERDKREEDSVCVGR
jgi:hypothetical protein